ncbi:MAG: DMT family transporter [Candidatus Delongbacteria bacterium]|nr:DMT family transporter [Candidatus Delongbacteria bacterium]MBN2835825.1 DMT family transporter [Candidatus Delongbacteria bacterium]
MPKEDKKLAVSLMLLSSLSFAIMGLMVKFSGDIPVFEKVFARNLISLFVAIIVLVKSSSRFFGKLENQKFLFLRSLLGLSGVALFFYAIHNMNLADSSMLNKMSPFFVTIFASLFLKEKITRRSILILVIVFLSVLLIVKPKLDFTILPAFAGLTSAACAGGAYTILRYLKDKEKPETIVFYFSLFSVIVMFPLMMINFVIPSLEEFFALLGIGVFAGIAQILLTYSYRYGKASELSIYSYTNVVFSGVFGFVFMKEIPDILSFVGITLIVVTSTYFYKWSKS